MNLVHPLTCITDRYIVGDRFHDGVKTSGHKKDTCKYHHMDLYPELKQYKSVTSEVINSKIKSVGLRAVTSKILYIISCILDWRTTGTTETLISSTRPCYYTPILEKLWPEMIFIILSTQVHNHDWRNISCCITQVISFAPIRTLLTVHSILIKTAFSFCCAIVSYDNVR